MSTRTATSSDMDWLLRELNQRQSGTHMPAPAQPRAPKIIQAEVITELPIEGEIVSPPPAVAEPKPAARPRGIEGVTLDQATDEQLAQVSGVQQAVDQWAQPWWYARGFTAWGAPSFALGYSAFLAGAGIYEYVALQLFMMVFTASCVPAVLRWAGLRFSGGWFRMSVIASGVGFLLALVVAGEFFAGGQIAELVERTNQQWDSRVFLAFGLLILPVFQVFMEHWPRDAHEWDNENQFQRDNKTLPAGGSWWPLGIAAAWGAGTFSLHALRWQFADPPLALIQSCVCIAPLSLLLTWALHEVRFGKELSARLVIGVGLSLFVATLNTVFAVDALSYLSFEF